MTLDPGVSGFLLRLSRAFEAVGIEYAVVGSVASSYHGEPRGTQDIDIVAKLYRSDVAALAKEFPEEEFYCDRDMMIESTKSRQPFNIIHLETMWKADIILPREPYTNEKIGRRERVEIGGVPIYMITAEDTIVSKMQWSKLTESERQLTDCAGILRARGEGLDRDLIAALVTRFELQAEWARVLAIAAS